MIFTVKKATLASALVSSVAIFNAQTIQDGINSIDSHKYKQAKEIFEKIIQQNPKESKNYFYLGNTFLFQFQPNYSKAEEYFKKGLELSANNPLNKIGLATIKLGNGNKNAIQEIKAIADASKDAEVLYNAAQALIMFEENNEPNLAIEYLNKAIEKTKNPIPAQLYYTMGDAFRIKKDAGSAMNAYEKSLETAKNKAAIYTRMATLWLAASQYKLSDDNIKKAIAADSSYAPVYKALAAYKMKFQENSEVSKALINYSKYADEDPNTQLEIAKLHFINADYKSSQSLLQSIFSKIEDPIKFKLRAYNEYKIGGNLTNAKQDLEQFKASVSDKSKILPADLALEGLIKASEAKNEQDENKKTQLQNEAKQLIDIARNAKDQTLDWENELMIINGESATQEDADKGANNEKTIALNQKIKANPNDANSIVELATTYTELKNFKGAIFAWNKMISLSPDWTYAYYAKGTVFQQMEKHDLAENSYQKFIDLTIKKPKQEQEGLKEPISYAYYLLAHYNQAKNLQKAKEYINKAVEINPEYQEAIKLQQTLLKK